MGMFNDFKYHNLGSLTEANFAGQKRGEESMTVDSTLATADANRQNTLERLAMDQQLQPFKLQRAGLENVGLGYDNDGKKTSNQQKDLDLIKSRMQLFIDAVGGGEDPVDAGERYGIPPKAVEGWSRLTPEQRAQVADKMATGTQAARAGRAEQTARYKEQIGVVEATGAQQRQTQKQAQDAQMKRLELTLEAKRNLGDAAAKNRSYQQAATYYFEAAQIASEKGDSTEAVRLMGLANQMASMAQAQAAVQRPAPAGTPDVGAMTNGQVPTVQQQAPAQFRTPGTNTNTPQQLKTPSVSNW